MYDPFQQAITATVARKGYWYNVDWITHTFSGTDHRERDWAARLEVPLLFLLARR
jgi:hypothetical protein